MAKYVLVSDPTLSRDYHGFPLLDFITCAPTRYVPTWLYEFLAGRQLPHYNGRARLAPYALRKVEAGLLARYGPNEVVVAHPQYAHLFIRDDTKIVGVHTMDPVGLGPVTMMFTNGRTFTSIEENTFSKFMSKLHRERLARNSHAKIIVGGPGSWELSYLPGKVRELHIDHVIQGEIDDVAPDLFERLAEENLSDSFMFGFQTFDEHYRKLWSVDPERVFVTRATFRKQFPQLSEIPTIKGATVKGLVEVMRGCGVGCDFCEVTLRPLRYYEPETVKQEIEVNRKEGISNCWFHSDEIFAYEHGRNFEPNEDALLELFSAIMETGVKRANPTHGRISIPAGFPELIERLSAILHAGPENWIGIQMGLETGSDELAKKHMPNKTLPLHIGADGTWAEIVTEGLVNLNRNYWRPAFTVQIGQEHETPEDNWMTVGLINDMSNANLEFTVTPLVNVPLGLLKTRGGFYPVYDQLDEAQASVIFACFRHLQKIVFRNVASTTQGNPLTRFAIMHIMTGGITAILTALEHMFNAKSFSMERAKKHTLGERQIEKTLEHAIAHQA
jgi:radical SAM superfamily enzyme YgiQ (UPF0313 family)